MATQDPRGPERKIVKVVATEEATLLTFDACGHVGRFTSHHHYRVGDRARCFACAKTTISAPRTTNPGTDYRESIRVASEIGSPISRARSYVGEQYDEDCSTWTPDRLERALTNLLGTPYTIAQFWADHLAESALQAEEDAANRSSESGFARVAVLISLLITAVLIILAPLITIGAVTLIYGAIYLDSTDAPACDTSVSVDAYADQPSAPVRVFTITSSQR